MRIFAVFLLLLFGANGWSLTLAEIRAQVRRNVRDTSTSASFQRYSDAVLTDTINTAQREIVNGVWVLSTDATFSSTVGTMFYDQPTTFLAPLKVGYLKTGSTSRIELTEKTLAGLYAMNASWETQTGTPTNYYVRQKPGGTVKQIGLYPAPVAASVGTVYLTYALIPNNLSADADVPFNGAVWLVQYHKTIVDYATGLLKQVEGKMDEANGYFTLAGAGINRMRERLGELPNYNPGMVTGSGSNR